MVFNIYIGTWCMLKHEKSSLNPLLFLYLIPPCMVPVKKVKSGQGIHCLLF